MLTILCSRAKGVYARRINRKDKKAVFSSTSHTTPTRPQDIQDTLDVSSPCSVAEPQALENEKAGELTPRSTISLEKPLNSQEGAATDGSLLDLVSETKLAGFGIVTPPSISGKPLGLCPSVRPKENYHQVARSADSIAAIENIEKRLCILCETFVWPSQLDFLPGAPGDAVQMASTPQNVVWKEHINKLVGLLDELESVQTTGVMRAREARIAAMNRVLVELHRLGDFKRELWAKRTNELSEEDTGKRNMYDRFRKWLTTVFWD